jgi:GT2 family glycosyltransferase
MTRRPTRVSFVIPVRNDADRLRDCLSSIAAGVSADASVEVIVADNGSTDGSALVAREAGARVLSLPGLRVADLRNAAARESRGDVLAFVDADHRLDPGWLASALESLANPLVVAVGAPYHAPGSGTWVQRMYDGFRDHATAVTETTWLGSGNMVVRRPAFEAVGGFDATLETCEDVDLCQRLRARGGRILHDPRMRSTHLGDPATLGALFVGELWRGRDNLRASARHALAWRDLPSLVIPVADLVFIGFAIVGLAAVGQGGLRVAAAALTAIWVLAGLRTAVMLKRLGSASLAGAAQAFAVAVTYDVARALAPVWKGSHGARRRTEVR